MGSGASSGNLLVYFGQQLRRLRAEAGMTQEELGTKIGYSAALVGMVEKGRRAPSYQLAAMSDQLLDARGVLEGLWLPIHEQATPDEQFDEFVELESRATGVDTYQSHLVPGLLQTEDYARAVVTTERPPVPAAEITARVALRMSRQELLTGNEPSSLWAVIGEAVLYQQVGDREVMRKQLELLLEFAETPVVTLQVLPFSTPGPAMGVSFSVLLFATHSPVVYLDVLTTGIYHRGKAGAVSRYQAVFNYLREAALPQTQSVALIAERMKELE